MSVVPFKWKLENNEKPVQAVMIDSSNDLEAIDKAHMSAGSQAVLPNGMRYTLSPSGAWVYDVSTYGGAADALSELPHTLNIDKNTGAVLKVEKGSDELADGALVYYGDELTVTYSASTGYTLKCFGNGREFESSPATFTVSVGGDVFIEAIATADTYDLTITEGENTTVEVSSGTGADKVSYSDGDLVSHDTELTITATPATGYTVTTFTVNAGAETSPASHTVASDVAVVTEATLNSYTLTLSQGANTTLTVLDGETPVASGASVDHGTVLSVSAEAADGYDLTTFTIGDASKLETNPAEHTMTAAVTITTAATQQEE